MENVKTLPYCCLCGNEKTAAADKIGTDCRALLRGPLALPWAFYQECASRNSRCCGGIGTGNSHLYFHAKGWECYYGDAPLSVTVEMGVSFYQDHAQTYYVYDTGNDTGSTDYGPAIPYPARVDDQAFWDALDAQLVKSGEAAWNDDWLTCAECGNHYYSPHGPCCEGEKWEIQTRQGNGPWANDTVGDINEFDSEAEALEMIEELKRLENDSWREGEYRAVKK